MANLGLTNSNPWLSAAADAMTSQVNNNLQRNLLPGIGRGAVANGLYGSSRQGIAEGLAMGDASQGLANSLAGMYSNAYGQDLQHQLGLKQADVSLQNAQTAAGAQMAGNQLSYNLGQDRLGLDTYNANQNWMRQGQQDQIGLINSMLGWNNLGLTAANNAQQTPINNWQTFTNGAAQMGGQGGTSSTPNYTNPWMGAIGGWQLGQSIFGG